MPNNFGGDQYDPEYKPKDLKKALKLPGARGTKPRLSPEDGEWFRKRFLQKDDECRELRKAIEAYVQDLSEGGLSGRLLAKELTDRIAKIRKR